MKLVDIVGRGFAFFEDGCVAGPVPTLEADLANCCAVDLLKVGKFCEGLAGWFFGEDGFAGFEELGEDVVVRFGRGADEDASDGGIVEDIFEIVGEAAVGEEWGELFLPVGALRADIFQPDVVVPEDGIEAGHAVDAESDEGVLFLRLKEGALKVLFLPVLIKSL